MNNSSWQWKNSDEIILVIREGSLHSLAMLVTRLSHVFRFSSKQLNVGRFCSQYKYFSLVTVRKSPKMYTIEERGAPNSLDYRIYFRKFPRTFYVRNCAKYFCCSTNSRTFKFRDVRLLENRCVEKVIGYWHFDSTFTNKCEFARTFCT